MEINDTAWNSMTQHSLGRVKNRESLFQLIEKVRKSQEPAFNQQSNLIQHFLSKRHYIAETYSNEYCRADLLSDHSF